MSLSLSGITDRLQNGGFFNVGTVSEQVSEEGAPVLHHMHRHLRGGAILAAITGGATLLAWVGIADHMHALHASVG